MDIEKWNCLFGYLFGWNETLALEPLNPSIVLKQG